MRSMIAASIAIGAICSTPVVAKPVWVDGYCSVLQCVSGYWKTEADDSYNNNYSTSPNANPNGKIGKNAPTLDDRPPPKLEYNDPNLIAKNRGLPPNAPGGGYGSGYPTGPSYAFTAPSYTGPSYTPPSYTAPSYTPPQTSIYPAPKPSTAYGGATPGYGGTAGPYGTITNHPLTTVYGGGFPGGVPSISARPPLNASGPYPESCYGFGCK